MSRPSFSETEKKVRKLFKKGTQFTFEGIQWTVLECDKPRSSKGECKTDVYLLVGSTDGEREIKISVKQTNANFFENKMSYDRAQVVFGKNVDTILSESLKSIKDKFEEQYLITLKQYKKTKAKSIKLGWKYELLNVESGDLSGIIPVTLTKDQLMEVYCGTKLPENKRNAKVNGKVIKNSGVADYILVLGTNSDFGLNDCVKGLSRISDYVDCHKELYFACKALNYRVPKSKWDSDRPLFVYVDWKIDNGKLKGELVFSEPLKKAGNEIGNNVKNLLQQLNISADNFDSIRNIVDDNVRIYPLSIDSKQ